MPGPEAAGGDDRLLGLALGAMHSTVRTSVLAHIVLGIAPPLTESSSFAAFYAGLPYPVASAILQGTMELCACK